VQLGTNEGTYDNDEQLEKCVRLYVSVYFSQPLRLYVRSELSSVTDRSKTPENGNSSKLQPTEVLDLVHLLVVQQPVGIEHL